MKIFMRILLSFTFLITCGLITGQIKDMDAPIPPDQAIKIGKLDNGITYYIKYNKKPEKRIELRLAINAGSICESENQLGLAHFCEHMCFNGTKNFPSNRIIDMLEEMGMKFGEEINAYTGFDQTVYMLKVPADRKESVNMGFQVLEDWAHQVSMEEEEIDKERNVIIEEWRLGLGAEERMMQKYLPVLLKDSRYAERLPIGKVEILESFPYDTLRSFYKTWYRPDLMAVIVVGDIDPAAAEMKVKEYFGRIPSAGNVKPREEYPVPDNDEPLISVVTDREASGYAAQIMFKQPDAPLVTYNDYRNARIRTLYIGMLNSRLQELTVKPEAPFLYAGSGYGDFIGRSIDVYQLFVAAKENKLKESIEALLSENEKVRQYGFTSTELERQKKELLTLYENGAKEADKVESGDYADEYIRNYLDRESIPGYQREYEMVKEMLPGITLDEVNMLGEQWGSGRNIIALLTAQEKEGVQVPTEQQVRDIIISARAKKVNAYVDEVTEAPLLKNLPVPSEVISRKENKEFGYTEILFGNGVKMVLKPTDYKNDEIILTAFSPGGISLYPDHDVMSASMATTIISQSGLGDYDFTGLQKKLSGNTANISPYISDLREGLNGSCTPKDLETMLQLNYLYFTGIRKDADAFNSYLSRMRNMIRPMRSVPRVIFQDTLSKIISMNSPRVIAVPSEKQLDQVSHDRIMDIYRDRFSDASDFTYVMAGNFNVDDVLPMLELYIGGLPSIKRKEQWRDLTPDFPEGKVSVSVPINSEPQSQVAVVWKGDFRWKPEERQAFAMLISILEIKLRESMREDQGGVYGVGFSGNTTKLPHPQFTVSSQWGCKPENVEQLTQTLIDEMLKIRKDGPSVEDINKIRETMIRERETQVKENGFWISYLQNHYLYGTRILSLEEYRELVNSISAGKIKAVAEKYLDTDNYVRVYLSPKEKAEPGN